MPPGSAKKRIGAFGHHVFALVHVVHHVQFVTRMAGKFFFQPRPVE
jgi:hypothetical protein